MEIRGKLGTEHGKIVIGKHCIVCGHYFTEAVVIDDYNPMQHDKDDECLDCMVNNTLIPAINRATEENIIKDRIIENQNGSIELYKSLVQKLQNEIKLLTGATGFDRGNKT